MLSKSNINIIETLRAFNNSKSGEGLDVCFLVPTRTGMEKSIMDATQDVRDYFKKKDLHDFDCQGQGNKNKVSIDTLLFSNEEVVETKCTLYRPETKNGDPRMWIYGLKKQAQPTDLLALLKSRSGLVVVNCSKTDLDHLLDTKNDIFWSNFEDSDIKLNERARDLLEKLKNISSQGFIKTLRRGDTGIGFTLETLLGIKANSSSKPDYRGIELKSSRSRSRNGNRITIFSKVPNWKNSRLKGSRDILNERGYFDEKKNRRQLFHTFSCISPNSLNMMLNLNKGILFQDYIEADKITHDVQWEMHILQQSLKEKHAETFWVYADVSGCGDDEKFHYVKAKYTAGADPLKLDILLQSGGITVDYTITERPNGSAKDQGYLFKIKPEDLELMFLKPIEFDLRE